jgi:hypothetical protein
LDLPQLLPLIEQLPQRSLWQHSTAKAVAAVAKVVKLPKRTVADQPQTVFEIPDVAVLEYELVEWSGSDSLKDALYGNLSPTTHQDQRCFTTSLIALRERSPITCFATSTNL